MNVERLNEDRVLGLLERKYPSPAWAFLRYVRNGTGWAGSRTSDGLAMSLWPSRGLELHGFEVKTYRSDWLRELKNPKKAEVIAAFCDRWWVVAGGADVVLDVGEIPPKWGLLVVKKTPKRGWNLCTVKEAEKLDAQPLDRLFLAALLRRTEEAFVARRSGMISHSEIATEIEAAEKEGEERARCEVGTELRVAEQMRRAVKIFEARAGLKINLYTPELSAEVLVVAEEIVHMRRRFDMNFRGIIRTLNATQVSAKKISSKLSKIGNIKKGLVETV